MKRTALAVGAFLLAAALPALSQETRGPNISGKSVQASRVDLDALRGEKNVLLVFYRMHS